MEHAFWIGLLKIIWINILLSGDNAVVIALAARALPEHQQNKAIWLGSGAAVVLRIGLTLVAAIRTILIADLVMSLDNVIAVAAAAKGNDLLLLLGLAISIPLVIFGSSLMIKLMARFPIIVVLGAALIGWVGGETIASDVAFKEYADANQWLHYAAAALGAVLVVITGKFLQKRHSLRSAA